MPRRQPSPCTMPGCPELVEGGGPCPEHSRRLDRARGTPAERGYGGSWPKIRARYLKWHPWCSVTDCGKRAVVADHVVRRKLLVERGVVNPDADEHLQSLCKHHHDQKTARETGFGGHHGG